LLEEFSSAAFALEIGAISDIVESRYGFHIIIRDPLDSAKMNEFVGLKITEKFQKYLLARAEVATIKYTAAFDRLVVR